LLCVAAVSPHKGHDILLAALAELADQAWRCDCVGPLDRDPAYVSRMRCAIDAEGLGGRLSLIGLRVGPALDRAYRSADLLVHAAPTETYGMVVTEALAHGVPVIAVDAGGLPEALGHAPDGTRPGMLVPSADGTALAVALRAWLCDAGLRARLRYAAMQRRAELPSWRTTTHHVARALTVAVT
jgi:glycosyltransferase involved in cell wall biosynthesis